MVDNHKIPVYWPSNMNNEYESEWKYDSKQDKVINTDSAFCIFLMVRVVRLARTVRVIVEARVDWTVTVWSRKIARMIRHRV